MPPPSLPPSRKAAVLAAVFLLNTSFLCSEKEGRAGLPPVRIDTLNLVVQDPALGTRGALLAWNYPAGHPISSLELYRTFKADSLGEPVLSALLPAPTRVQVEIPDSSPPFTIYFGLRPVFTEPTGQKTYGDSVLVDSLRVTAPATVQRPASGAMLLGRQVVVEVQTGSDPGQIVRQLWYERGATGWAKVLEECLPRTGCFQPLFGSVVLLDSVVLGPAPADVPGLFCALSTETSAQSRGLRQSLGCVRYTRRE